MAKFLKSVETLMAQVLISVYGEVLLVTGIAYHNQKDNCVGVDFYVSERQGDHLNFCVAVQSAIHSAQTEELFNDAFGKFKAIPPDENKKVV